MKKDKLEKALQQKLGNVEVTPPGDMWARLNADLAPLRRENAFDAGDNAADPSASERYEPKIRRPARRRMSWTYVAASVAACVTLAFAVYQLRPGNDTPVAGNGLQQVEPEGFILHDGEHSDGVAGVVVPDGNSGTVAERAPAEVVSGYVASRIMPAGAGRSVSSGSADMRTIVATTEGTGTDTGHVDPSADTNRQTQDNSSAQPGTTRYGTTSDTKQGGGLAVLPHGWAENNRNVRRGTSFTASLFASNSGLTGGNDVKSGTIMPSSAFMLANVTESDKGVVRSNSATEKYKHNPPLTFGINLGIGLGKNISLQTGINYTYMKSESEQVLSSDNQNLNYTIEQKLHYIGVPVALKFDFVDRDKFDLYVMAGGTLEKCVSATALHTYQSKGTDISEKEDRESIKIKGVQPSVNASIGFEYKFDDTFGLYFEPGVNYYFKTSRERESFRTENPLTLGLRAGLRINL